MNAQRKNKHALTQQPTRPKGVAILTLPSCWLDDAALRALPPGVLPGDPDFPVHPRIVAIVTHLATRFPDLEVNQRPHVTRAGLRTPGPGKRKSYESGNAGAHYYGNAVDLKTGQKSALRSYILANFRELGIVTAERFVKTPSWTHISISSQIAHFQPTTPSTHIEWV